MRTAAAGSALLALVLLLAITPLGAGDSRISDHIRGQAIAATSPPLDRPALRTVAGAAHMRDDDVVFGVVFAGRARAYPWWVVKNYHVVNDVVAEEPVLISFCEQCTGAAAFRRTLDGRALSFEVAGVYNGTIILRDRETRSLWAPFSGRAVEGRLAGRRLDRIPASFTRWDQWAARHPEGEVVFDDPSRRGGHGEWYGPGKWGIVSEMGETLQSWDPRLTENALVYGIEGGATAKGYPLAEVRARAGVINDELAAAPVVVVARGELDVAGYERKVKDRVLTFRPSPGLDAVMTDEETGSAWSGEGEALSGALRGERLVPVDGYLVEWHVWSAYHPGAAVFEGAAEAGAVREGLRLPALALRRLDGPVERLPLSGRVNLIVLWAAWCPPCKEEMPRLGELVRKHSAQGLAAVSIAIHIPGDEVEEGAVKGFVKRARLAFPTFLIDDPGYEKLDALAASAGGPGLVLPMVFAADTEGRLLGVFRGKDTEGRLARAIAELLEEKGT